MLIALNVLDGLRPIPAIVSDISCGLDFKKLDWREFEAEMKNGSWLWNRKLL